MPAGDNRRANAGSSKGSGDQIMDGVEQTMADDEWRRWIAENLMIGEPSEGLAEILKSEGFSDEEALRELQAAGDSPYVKGARTFCNGLKDRDWLLAVYRKNRRLRFDAGEIERRHRLSRHELLHHYYSINRAVVITGLIDDWPALRKWNLDYLAQTFGDRQVEVRTARTVDEKTDSDAHGHWISRIKFETFVDAMRMGAEKNDFHLTAHHASTNWKALSGLWDDIVPVPEYLAANRRQAGVLWMAPRDTTAPFHHDLANRLIAQVLGRTRMKLAPSWDLPLMRNTLHWFSRVDGRVTPRDTQPTRDEPQIFELILEPGEVLFLPVGWMHLIEAMETSVTVTFTNFVFDNDFASFYTTYGRV
jgi:hypothetical protein